MSSWLFSFDDITASNNNSVDNYGWQNTIVNIESGLTCVFSGDVSSIKTKVDDIVYLYAGGQILKSIERGKYG